MNEYYISRENESEEDIEHYGVRGMKWGVRRYQKKDGSLTRLGKKHKQYALNGLNIDMENYGLRTATSKFRLKNMESHNKQMQNSSNKQRQYSKDDLTDQARIYLNNYLLHTNYQMLNTAYMKNKISVGKDYVSDKYGRVTLSDTGRQKESKIYDRAIDKTIKDNQDIIKKYNIAYKVTRN